MDYLSWNNLIAKHFFNESIAGREVLLYINDEVLNALGEPHEVGVDDFIESLKKGPDWATRSGFCQKALQAFEDWRQRGFDYPPYVSYLACFVLAGVTETNYASHSYYPGFWKRLGEPQDSGIPPSFYRMIDLWDDLEKWSREDKHEDLGRFIARIRGGYWHVGLPRSQTVLSEHERKLLPNLFDEAGLDPTDSPSPDIIPKILRSYGEAFLERRTLNLLDSTGSDVDALKKALTEVVLDELEDWDGTVHERIVKGGTPRQHIHTSLRICIKLDTLAARVTSYVRLKTNRIFPEEELQFSRRGDGRIWQCFESKGGWSKPLIDTNVIPPEVMGGELLDWSGGEQLADNESHWRAGLRGGDVRLFRKGIDGLPDWIETHRLERAIEFLLACKSSIVDQIRKWGEESCEKFEQIRMEGLPSGWLLFYGRNATQSCAGIDHLTLSTIVRLLLLGGIKAGKGIVYFKFAPPMIVLENRLGSEKVMLDGKPLGQPDGNIPVFMLPENVPAGLPLRIEVDLGDNRLSKVIRLEEFNLPDSFEETPFRDNTGEICSGEVTVRACGAHIFGVEDGTDYQGPGITLLSEKIIFLGERPGEVSTWPDEPFPSSWEPVWAVAKRGRKNWEIVFCGAVEQLRNLSRLPAPVSDRSKIRLWKEAVWHMRKRYTLPGIAEVRSIWNGFVRLAKNV